MCTEISVPSEGLLIETIGQLKARVGAENVRLSAFAAEGMKDVTPEQMATSLADDICLCGIDVRFAAASAGFYLIRDTWGVVWKRRPVRKGSRSAHDP